MTTITTELLHELKNIVGPANVLSDAQQLLHKSRDHYYFSPVLIPLLDDKRAEVMVTPGTQDELIAVIALAARARVPLTLRGAGTGNYGQGVPMHGGILLNILRLNQIVTINQDIVRAQAGVKLVEIERQALTVGAELRCYPSTLLTATIGGFIAGGAGGIGSVTWGTLWDEGNVLGATVITVEETPRVLTVQGPTELQGVIHNCGLTCVIADVSMALAPAMPWAQFAVSFERPDDALRFGQTLAFDEKLDKRLISMMEWPIPSYFRQLIKQGIAVEGKALVLLELVQEPELVAQLAGQHNGVLVWHSPHEHYHVAGKLLLSDYTWNHTTLWAIKHDPNLTYLQDAFDPEGVFEQIALRKARYGDDLLTHIEFMKFKGRLLPQGMSIVRFRSKAQLWEMIDYCESIGQWIANPHTHKLDEDVRWNGQPILDARQRWDPYGLLNPGHLQSLEAA